MSTEPTIQEDLDMALHGAVEDDERLKLFAGTCQEGDEPNWEYLKRHLEVWTSRHPQEMREFLEYKKEVTRANFKTTGASLSGNTRRLGDVPIGIYKLFSILAPNFCGGKEISPEKRKTRMREFFKNFPVFQTAEKL